MKNFPFSIKDSSEIYQKQIISMHSATKDLSKRFKALQGLHKSHEHSKNSLAEFFNNYSNPIFDVLYQSIIKFHPSKFRLSSGYDEIKNLFTMIRQCIENLEKERIKALVSDYGKEIYSLFYHTLDFFTKKEIRLHSFNILLRLIDAFLIEKIPENKTINNETKQVIEKDSTKLPTELHEYFLISIEFNLYNQKNFQGLNISPFQENCKLYLEEEKLNEIKNGEWLKLIKESNGNAGAEELILNEFFNFTKYEHRIKNWFVLLQQTWLKQIFETTKDKCKISPSKSYLLMSTSMDTSEVLDKKSIFIIHYKSNNLTDSATKINVQKAFILEFEVYLQILSMSGNSYFYMSEENFRTFTKIISEFYFTEDCSHIILNILKIYAKFFNFKITNDKPQPKLPVLFANQMNNLVIYLDLLDEIEKAILNEIEIIDKKCLNSEKVKLGRPDILKEIITYMLEEENRVHETLFKKVLDISLNILKKIEKSNMNLNANFDILSPLLKNILLYAIKLEAFFTPSWKRMKEYFQKFIMNKELMLSFNALLLEETEKLIKFMYNEEFLIIFQNIKMSKNNCKFRVEYTLQFFLHLHSQSHKCFDKSNPTNEIFHKENSDAINSIFVNKHPLFQSGCHKYSGWLHLIKLFIESNNCEISPNFETLCDGVACLIQQLLQPDQYFPIERGKPVPKPKYNPPAQTFLLIFENFFRGIKSHKKGNLEYIAFAYKSFFKIICEARSELDLPKETMFEFIKIVLEILTCDFDKIKDSDERKIMIEICLIYTSKIFTTEFSGIKLLIPYYFDAIHHIFLNTKKEYLFKTSHNEFITNILLNATKLSDFKIYINLLKNSCITILKSIYGVVKKYGDFEIRYKEKIVKLLEYKQNILAFIQCIIFEFDENLQLKIKNNTPTKNKKYKYEMIEDGHDFKNNFFSLVLYIMKDLKVQNIDDFKTIFQGIHKIMVNDLNNLEEYCDLCSDFIEALSFMGHELIQLKDNQLYSSTIETLISVLNNSESNSVKIKTLNCLLSWIVNDGSYQINLKPKIFEKISNTLRNLVKIEEMKDQVESFYSHLIVNIYNFPPRNQSVDNNKSLLNEVSLHYDIMGFLSDFAQTETTDTTYKKTISDQNFMTLELSKSAKFKILRKNISKSNPFPMDLKHLKKEKEIWNSSLKGNNNYASFLNKIGIKKIAFDETHLDNRLNIKAIQEEIQKLNQKMGNSFPDTIEFERINLFFSNNSIFSFLKGPQNTMKVIIRNISGKYSWVIKLFDAIGSDCIIKKYDNKGLEFKSYKNMIVQQEPGNSKRNRAITQTQEYFELKTLIRRPEKGKVALTLLKSVETIEKENDFSQTLKDIVGKIEEFCQFDKNHFVDFDERVYSLKRNMDSDPIVEMSSNLENNLNSLNNSAGLKKQEKSDNTKNKRKPIWETGSRFFNGIRSFLIQNGFLTPENLKSIKILNDNPANYDQYQNLINVLDQTSNRETIKIGILYVGPHQENQKDILMNCKGSNKYDWFLSNLGKKIELDKHLGFLGGLKEINDGKYAIYYANSQVEIIYHVATYMPTVQGDDQQINKKRHVGNDHVTIIWSDNQYEYRKNTIQSQYNCVVIIIYPLKHFLFKIQVFKKEKFEQIYPWIDGAILGENDLVPLIRLFSLNAHKKVRTLINVKNIFSEFNPYLRRKNFIEEIINKFGIEKNQEVKTKMLLTILHNKIQLTKSKMPLI